jgi:hypothetical protein
VNVQLVHDLLAVGFHGFHADVKSCGYFLGGFALPFVNEYRALCTIPTPDMKVVFSQITEAGFPS